MTSTWHRITVLNEDQRIGECSVCGLVRLKRRKRRGNVEWSCLRRHRQYMSHAPHRRAITDCPWCSRCGFFPEHKAQLDVHHIDGDHGNNDPSNLLVLCANCHRLQHTDPDDRDPQGGVTPREIRLVMEIEELRKEAA